MSQQLKSSDSKTLMEMITEAQKIETQIIESEGVITPELEQSLMINEKQLAQKVDAYEFVTKNLLSRAEFFRDMARKYETIAQSLEKTEGFIKQQIKFIMQQEGLSEIKGNQIRYKLTASQPKLVITDEKAVPSDYQLIICKLDNTRIKEALKEGKEISGAKLEPSFALKSYPNTK